MLSNVPDDNKTIMIGVQATLGEADKEYQSIVGLVREVESIVKQHQIPGGLENPYTTLTAHVSLVRFNFLFSSSQYVVHQIGFHSHRHYPSSVRYIRISDLI